MKIWRNMRCKYGETQWNSTPVFCIITARWNYISHIAFTNLVMNNRNISPIFWSSKVRFLHCWLGSTVLLIILILITYQSQTNNVIVLFKYSTILFRLERCFGYAVKAKNKSSTALCQWAAVMVIVGSKVGPHLNWIWDSTQNIPHINLLNRWLWSFDIL